MRRVSLAFLVAIPFVLHSGFAYSIVNREAANLYEKALIEKENDELKAAIIHLKNALQLDDSYIAAHVLLGGLYLEDGSPALAEKELAKAINMGVDRSVTVIPLAESYYAQHNYRKLTDGIFPQNYDAKTATRLFIFQANAHIELKALDSARDAFDAALKATPNSIEAILGLAIISLKEGNYQGALDYVNHAFELDIDNAQTYYLKGMIDHAKGDLDAAVDNYSKAIERESDHLSASIARIGIYLDLNKKELALSNIDSVRESHPDDPRAAYLHAVLLAKMGDEARSREILLEANSLIDKFPTEVLHRREAVLMLAGIVKFSLGEHEKAREYLKSYVSQYPNNPGARKLYGSLLLKIHDYQTAVRILEPNLEQTPNDHGLLIMLGQAYMKIGKHYQASEVFDRALKIQPEDDNVQFQVALSNLASGKSNVAQIGFAKSFDKNVENKQAGIILNLLYIKEKNFAKALAVTEKLVLQFPDNLSVLNLLASNQMATNRIDEASSTLKKAMSIDESFVPAQVNYSKILIRQKKYDAAEEQLQRALQLNPTNPLCMIELGRLAYIRGNRDEAVLWYEKAYAKNSDSQQTAIALINFYLADKQHAQALRVAEEAMPGNTENLEVMEAVARTYLAANKIKLAQLELQRMSALAGYNSAVLMRVADLQMQAHDVARAIWSLQKVIEGDGSNLPARVLLTETLINKGNFVLAEEHAQKIIELFPGEPQGYGLMGDINLANKAYLPAIKSYKNAYQKQQSTYAVLKLSQAYFYSGELNSAIKVLNDWLKNKPNDSRVIRTLGEYYLASNNLELAKKYFEAALNYDANNPDILNNLALLLLDSNKEEALAYAEKANQISPNDPAINDTLGWILVKNNRPEEGIQYLRSAAMRNASNPETQYHIAVALDVLGRRSEALKALKLSLDSGVSFPEINDAKRMLDRLGGK